MSQFADLGGKSGQDQGLCTYEVLDLDTGRIERLEALDHAAAQHARPDTESIPADAGWRGPIRHDHQAARTQAGASNWRTWVMVGSVLVAAGALMSRADTPSAAESDAPIAAGHLAINGSAAQPTSGSTTPDIATISVTASVQAVAGQPVELVAVQPAGWPPIPITGPLNEGEPEPLPLPPGEWIDVTTSIQLDCRQHEPLPPTWLDVDLNTPTGERTYTVPLTLPAWDVPAAWRSFCPAQIRAARPAGLYP